MRYSSSILFFFYFLVTSLSHGEILRLAKIFTDHCVLQRDMAVPIWGWADPQTEIQVEFAGQVKNSSSDQAGKSCDRQKNDLVSQVRRCTEFCRSFARASLRPRMFIQQTLMYKMVFSIWKHGLEDVRFGMLWLAAYVFLLRVPSEALPMTWGGRRL